MDEAHGWSVRIETIDGERKIVLEIGDQMLWLDADRARELAASLEGKAAELEGLTPTD
jgi:hypothetical protein